MRCDGLFFFIVLSVCGVYGSTLCLCESHTTSQFPTPDRQTDTRGTEQILEILPSANKLTLIFTFNVHTQ